MKTYNYRSEQRVKVKAPKPKLTPEQLAAKTVKEPLSLLGVPFIVNFKIDTCNCGVPDCNTIFLHVYNDSKEILGVSAINPEEADVLADMLRKAAIDRRLDVAIPETTH